jgi:DNA-binding transcriptional MerR regulator
MSERSHLSIGEVLSLLREEFPDITISKIRFLESQGLVDPERTPSGYRKFYDHDVDRLRWILRQQREHFLPLKVIRGRLTDPGDEVEDFDNGEADRGVEPKANSEDDEATPSPSSSSPAARAQPAAAPAAPEPEPAAIAAAVSAGPSSSEGRSVAPQPARPPSTEPRPDRQAAPVAATATPAPPKRAPEPGPSRPAPNPVTPSLFAEARSEAARTAATAPKAAGTSRRGRPVAEESESYSAEELASAAGATTELVAELKQFGLVSAHAVVAGTPYFDDCALAVTRAAAEFARYGVEVRHLRAWRNAADREAGLFEQIVLPLLRQRNPQARQHATETLTDLARLGADLRLALVDQAIRQIR